MKSYLFNILVRVIIKRVRQGEDLQEVLNSYPNIQGEDRVKVYNTVLANI